MSVSIDGSGKLTGLDQGLNIVGLTTVTNSLHVTCLLYTSPSPRDATLSRMPSSA